MTFNIKKIIPVLFLLLSLNFYGQEKNKVKLILKNGTTLYGNLVEQNEQVLLETTDGNIFVYPNSDVQEIVEKPTPVIRNGAYHSMNFGTLTSDSQFNGTLTFVNGYQIKSKLFLGLGFGIEGFYNKKYIPVFFETQYHPFNKWRSQPFIAADLGKLLLKENESGGLRLGINAGMAHYLSKKVSLMTSVGYRYVNLTRDNDWWYCGDWGDCYHNNNREYKINRIEFKVGLLIK